MSFTNSFIYIALFLATIAGAATPEKEWKGASPPERFTLSTMGGLAILDGESAFGWPTGFGVKILGDGFVPDVTDQASLEVQLGPVFLPTGASLFFSSHLRWDFWKNEELGFYALGGFAGGRRSFHFRFGIGMLWEPFVLIGFRLELSHEFTGLGIQIRL